MLAGVLSALYGGALVPRGSARTSCASVGGALQALGLTTQWLVEVTGTRETWRQPSLRELTGRTLRCNTIINSLFTLQ